MNEFRKPGGLVQRCIIINRDENGYGLTVSGDNPVYVQSVKEKSAAAKAGVQVGDQIIKVNGTVVTQSNHIEVVRLIKSGAFVALTLLGKDHSPKSPTEARSPRSQSQSDGHVRSRSLGSNLAFHATPPPQHQSPTLVNSTIIEENKSNESVNETERILIQEREYHRKILDEYMRAPSQKSQQELADSQTRINALEHQLKVLSGSVPQKSFSGVRQPFRPVSHDNHSPWQPQLSPPSRTTSAYISSGYHSTGAYFTPREGLENQYIQDQNQQIASKKISSSTSSPDIESSTMNDTKRAYLDSIDSSDSGISSNIHYNSSIIGSTNSFDSLFLQAQQDNLMMPAMYPAESVISMEDDEFEFENERFDDHGPFIDLHTLRDRPAHLAVFLHFLMSNSNPSPLFFWLVADTYSQETTGHVKDLKKWAYEIYSTFIAETAPLKVDLCKPEELAIEEALENPRTSEERMRSVFNVSRELIFTEVNEQLADFRNKRALGLGGLFGDHQLEDDLDRAKELKVIEQTLIPHLEALMADTESSNEVQNNRNSAMASALATFMKQIGLNNKLTSKSNVLDRCRSFAEKGKKSFISNLKEKKRVHAINNHSFVSMQYSSLTLCGHCSGILWGIGTQGYQCATCEFNVHKRSCVELLTEICPGRKKKPALQPRPNQNSIPQKVMETTVNDHTENSDHLAIQNRTRGNTVASEFNNETKTESSTEETTESDIENKIPQSEDTPVVKKASTLNFTKGNKNIFPVSRNVLRSESLKSVKELSSPKSSVTLPGVNKKSIKDGNGVYGPMSFNAHKQNDKMESPPPESEEEEDTPDSDLDIDPEAQNWQNTVNDKKLLKRLKNKEVKRQEVIHELIHTERTHVRSLKVLNKVFYRPLLKKNILPVHQIKLIFPNLEELVAVHESLLIPLKARSKENEVIENIGDIMLERFDGEAGEKVKEAAAKFCRGQKNALEQMKKLANTKKEFQAFMTVQESHPLCRRLKFTDIMAATHQRFVKYPLLLEGINKATPAPHPDFKNVEKCAKCCKNIINYVNSEIKEAENKLRLEEIGKKIEDKRIVDTSDKNKDEEKFDITTHRMLYEGPLVWKINPTKKLDLHVILLTDFLVLLQRQDERYILKTHSTTLGTADAKGHSPIIKITNIIIREVATDKRAFFLVSTSMTTGPHIYELIAQTNLEKRTWVEHIMEAQERVKGKDMFSRSADRGRRGGLSVIASSVRSTNTHEQTQVESVQAEGVEIAEVVEGEDELDIKLSNNEDNSSLPETLAEERSLPSKERMAEISDELAEKDKEIKRLLEEKNILLCELQGLKDTSPANSEDIDVPLKSRDLVLAATAQADRLVEAVNNVVTLSKDLIPEDQRNIIGQSTSALHEYLTSLLDSVQSGENQLETLTAKMKAARATINHLKNFKDESIIGHHEELVDMDNSEVLDDTDGSTPTPVAYIPAVPMVSENVEENHDRFEEKHLDMSESCESNGDLDKGNKKLLVTSPFKIFRKRTSDPMLELVNSPQQSINRAASFSGFSSIPQITTFASDSE